MNKSRARRTPDKGRIFLVAKSVIMLVEQTTRLTEHDTHGSEARGLHDVNSILNHKRWHEQSDHTSMVLW